MWRLERLNGQVLQRRLAQRQVKSSLLGLLGAMAPGPRSAHEAVAEERHWARSCMAQWRHQVERRVLHVGVQVQEAREERDIYRRRSSVDARDVRNVARNHCWQLSELFENQSRLIAFISGARGEHRDRALKEDIDMAWGGLLPVVQLQWSFRIRPQGSNSMVAMHERYDRSCPQLCFDPSRMVPTLAEPLLPASLGALHHRATDVGLQPQGGS